MSAALRVNIVTHSLWLLATSILSPTFASSGSLITHFSLPSVKADASVAVKMLLSSLSAVIITFGAPAVVSTSTLTRAEGWLLFPALSVACASKLWCPSLSLGVVNSQLPSLSATAVQLLITSPFSNL